VKLALEEDWCTEFEEASTYVWLLVVVVESTESPRARVTGTANEFGLPEKAVEGEESSGSTNYTRVSKDAWPSSLNAPKKWARG